MKMVQNPAYRDNAFFFKTNNPCDICRGLLLFRKQILLEVGKVFRHWNALFLAPHESCQTIGYRHINTQDIVNFLLELSRMSGLAENAYLVIL